MTETYTETKGALIVHLKGELDQHSAVRLRCALDQKILRGTNHLILDLSELDFMDSSGIGIIVGRYKNLAALGGKVSLYGAKTYVDKILKLAAIDRIIPMYSNVEEALLEKRGEENG